MALTAQEEALVRQLIAQEQELLNLAANETEIISSMGVARVTLSELDSASSINDADLYLTRQGTDDKSYTTNLLAQYMKQYLDQYYLNASGDTASGAINFQMGGNTITPPEGDNDLSLASTEFVTRAISKAKPFPSGTKMTFVQASAPPGWTQDVSDNANNRMMRVVTAGGGGVGGIHAPILCDIVANHTHNFNTGGASAGHTHSGSTDAQGQHSHSYTWQTPETPSDGSLYAVATAYPQTTHKETNNGNTGSAGNHAHNFNTGGVSADHTHSGTTNGNNAAASWTPRYLNIIVCVKD